MQNYVQCFLEVRLKLGDVIEEDQEDPAQVGKVIRQTPPPNSSVPSSGSVSITLGRLPIAETSEQ